jgi:hypothetical protein
MGYVLNLPLNPCIYATVWYSIAHVPRLYLYQDDAIKRHFYRFAISSSSPSDSSPSSSPAQEYSVLTPLTPLAELQGFFDKTEAAFGLGKLILLRISLGLLSNADRCSLRSWGCPDMQ